MISELTKKHDLEYLLANTEVVLEQTKKQTLNNPTGYLLKALQNDYRPVQNNETFASVDSLPQDTSAKAERSIQDQILQLTAKIDTDELKIIRDSFILGLEAKDIMKKILDSKGFDHPIIQGQWLKYLQGLT